jgi:hypothetical protein
MDLDIVEILKKISSEEHLEILLPSKINKALIKTGLNLYEISLLTEEDFKKIDGLGVTKYKYLVKIIDEIKRDPTTIFAFKKHIIDVPIVIPSQLDLSSSYAFNVFLALTEFTSILQERIKLPSYFFYKVEYNAFSPLSNYIQHYYGINNAEILNFKEIGSKYKKSSESIRTNLFEYPNRSDLVDLFLHKKTGFGIKVNELLIDESKKIIENYLYSTKFIENFLFSYENISEIQLKRLVEVFNYTLETIHFDDFDYTFQTVLRKDEILEFKAHYRVLNSILRNGLKLTKEELIQEMKLSISNLPKQIINNRIKENGINLQMFEVILEEYIKLEIIEEEDHQLYQFKWQYLSSQLAKSTRILFEYNRVMSKEEIFEEFKTRENELGIDFSIESLDFLHIKATDTIHPIGKSGNWFYDDNYTKEKNSLALKVNKDFTTIFHGKIYLSDFLEYTKSKDFYQNYEVSSIRANILLCSKQAVHDSNLFIHNDYKDQYPEIELKGNRNKYLGNTIIKKLVQIFEDNEQPIKKNELIDLLISKLSEEGIIVKIRNNVFQYLLKFTDLGVLTKFEQENSISFQLDKEELSTYDIENIGKKQEPLYKTSIRSKAITFLKEKNKARLSEVFELVKSLAPEDIAKNNIYRIFNNDSIFIKEKIENDTWIYLNTPQLPAPQEMHVEVEEETTELLGTTPLQRRVHFDTIELKRAVIDELILEKNTYGLNQEIIFGTFESFIEIVLNNDRNSIWGKTLVQSIYESFCTKTDFYDRHMCVMNLIGSYETFLKMISPIEQNGRATGIVEIIHTIPEIKELYHYKNQEKIRITDRQKNNFSHILNKAKYLADLYRHDRSHEDLSMGNSKMMKSIVDFTALYLYTLYLVDRY